MSDFKFGDVVVPADDDEAEVYGTEPATVSTPPSDDGWMRVVWDAETIPVRADRWKRVEKAPGSHSPGPTAPDGTHGHPAASETPQDEREVERRFAWASQAQRIFSAEVAEYHATLELQADLLTRTANALRGDPPSGVMWSHHDVPDRAARLREGIKALHTPDRRGQCPVCAVSPCATYALLATPTPDAQDEVRRG